jgi:WD40 repeat protein
MTEEAAHPIVRSSTPVREFDDLGEVAAVAVFPDRRRMATNSSDGMLRVWDLNSGVMLMELEGRGRVMQDMALSQDGKVIASSDHEGYVFAWDGETGKRLTQAFRPSCNACWLDFSPDGATLATGSGYTTKLWSTKTWQLQGESFRCDRDFMTCIRYSSSGELLTMANYDKIYIWNPATKQRIATFNGVSSGSLVWTPDGTRLLSADLRSTTIREWDSSTWKQVGDMWKGTTSCRSLALSCNGTIVASPTTNNRVRLWRLSDWRTIAIFQHADTPCCITFTMDGKHILAGDENGKILKWAVPEHAWPEDAIRQVCLCPFSIHSSSHLSVPRLKTQTT